MNYCPICKKKRGSTLDECPECGERLIHKVSGIVRHFGESDEQWATRLKSHEAERAK
jgi:hypothetical protein